MLLIAPSVSQGKPGGGNDMLSRDLDNEVNKTYSATKSEGVVFGIAALCCLFVHGF